MRKILLLSVIFIALLGLSSLVYGADKGEQLFVTYKVQPGDSLWSIAKEFKEPNESIREMVYHIKKANEVKDFIQPGEKLKIPVDQL